MHPVDHYFTEDREERIKSLAYRGFYGLDEIVIDEDEDGYYPLCHVTGKKFDPYNLISVPASAMESHFPGHDDFFPTEGICIPPTN